MSQKDNLRGLIEAAFADAPKPGDDQIGYDPNDWESAELAPQSSPWLKHTPTGFMTAPPPAFFPDL